MKILVADKFPDSGRKKLEEIGDVSFEPDVAADDLGDVLGDHEVLIVRGKKVSGAAIEAAPALQLIVRAGAGTNTIDVPTASKHGIYVANCPGKNAIAVAELAIGLLISVDRRIPAASAALENGDWNKKEFSKADGLFGRTLGVIGVGGVGSEVIARAKALGMDVIAWSRSLTDIKVAALGIERASSIEELAASCDAVSVHLAHSADTKGRLGAAFFAALRPGAIVINTSRGGIVDEAALLQAIEAKDIRYAADVFDGEPGSGTVELDHPITKHPSTVCTPHIGASTNQAQLAVADAAIAVVRNFVLRGEVPNCVNLCAHSPAEWMLNVRHLDRVGVLASVLGQVREAEINVEELENIIFDGAIAACARITLAEEPSAELLASIAGTEHVIDVKLLRR